MTQIIMIDGGPVSVSYLGLSPDYPGTSSSPTWDSGSFDFGDANGALKVLCAVHCVGTLSNPNPQAIAATIGGETGVVIGGASSPSGSTLGLWWVAASVPAGGVGNAVVTFNTPAIARMAVYRVINAVSLTATDIGMNAFATGSTASQQADSDVKADGVYFSGCTVFHSDPVNFSGVTPDYNAPLNVAVQRQIIGGFHLATADETARISTVTKTGSLAMGGTIGAVSLR